ncbi:MAG: disulfide bond formation protein B [Pseudomonadota bacterium]
MTDLVSQLRANPRRALADQAPWLLILASAIILASAFAFEHIGGLLPCVLCLQQRWPHAIVVGIGLLILAGRPPNWASGLALIAAGGVLFYGAAVAMFHVGVEQHWWAGTSGCGTGALTGATAAELRAQLLATPVARCDEIVWSLLGLSMAGWNFILSVILGSIVALAGFDRFSDWYRATRT